MISAVGRAVGIGCLVGALAACTVSGTDDGPLPDDVAPPTDTPSSSDEPSPEVPEPREPGPLEAYLRVGEDVRSIQDLIAQMTWEQDVVAVCMTEQGFEYTPQVPAASQVEYLDGPVPGTREFVEDYGYGLWASPPGGTGGGGARSRTSRIRTPPVGMR